MSPPPTNIDGTDITGATIDGQEVQEITVDGQTVFTADIVIDKFEDGNINEYGGDLGSYSVTTSNPISGSASLLGNLNIKYIQSTSGLENYPQTGDTFSYKMRIEGNVNIFAGMVFGVQSDTTQNYVWLMSSGGTTDELRFRKNVESGGFGTELAQVPMSGSFTNDVFRFEVDWQNDGTIAIEVFNESTATSIGNASVTDTDYTSGGIGFHTSFFTNNEPSPDRILYDDAVIL